ncbi:hypothetical protein MKMG_01470 [Methanogenium sp. MK-MG]|nr:hypothetical protein MKMG_01470 [Methanogenium sp. MK-MG]
MLSMATALLCISPFLSVDVTVECLECCIYFLAGVFVGSCLPDADVAAAKELRPRKVKWFSYSVISIVMMRMVRAVYWVTRVRFDGRHRRSLHTIFGISVAVGVIVAPTWFILTGVGWWSDVFIFVYAGLLCGALFHLAEDCCTINGLRPFLPFLSLHLKGGINTGDYRDRRPVWYTKCMVCMASLVIAGEYVYHIPAGRLFLPVLGVVALSGVIFYLFSQRPHARRK